MQITLYARFGNTGVYTKTVVKVCVCLQLSPRVVPARERTEVVSWPLRTAKMS